MKIVVLASGGIDSALMLSMFKQQKHESIPLFFNYGQLALEKEWNACQTICEKMELKPFMMNIEGFGKLPSGLTQSHLDIYDDAFLPTRNLTFVTLGAAYAYSNNADVVAIGLLSNPVFPDQTKEFIKNAEISISTSLGKKIHLLAPLIDLDKRDILNMAKDFPHSSETYFCHSGTETPCGKCISCRERIAAEATMK